MMKKITRIAALLATAALLLAGFPACGDDDGDDDPTLTGIEIGIAESVKFVYNIGEEFDKTGITVTATYSDGSTKDVTDKAKFTAMTSEGEFTTAEAGTYNVTLTATYEGETDTATREITVEDSKTPPTTGDEGGDNQGGDNSGNTGNSGNSGNTGNSGNSGNTGSNPGDDDDGGNTKTTVTLKVPNEQESYDDLTFNMGSSKLSTTALSDKIKDPTNGNQEFVQKAVDALQEMTDEELGNKTFTVTKDHLDFVFAESEDKIEAEEYLAEITGGSTVYVSLEPSDAYIEAFVAASGNGTPDTATAKTYSFTGGENGIVADDISDWDLSAKDVINAPISKDTLTTKTLANGASISWKGSKIGTLRFRATHAASSGAISDLAPTITALNYNGGASKDISSGIAISELDRYVSIPVDGAGTVSAEITFKGAAINDNPTGGPFQVAFVDADGNLLGAVVTDDVTASSEKTVSGTVSTAGTVYLVFSRNGAKKGDSGTGGIDVSKITVAPAAN